MTSLGGSGVVLLGGTGSALSTARSLHMPNVHVAVLGVRSDVVRVSRSCDEFVDLGRGSGVQDRWFDWLVARPSNQDVVLACSDDGLELMSTRGAALSARGYRLGELNSEVVLSMLDKEKTYELARKYDVACPVTVTIRSDADVDVALETLPFPCAIKPLHSHLFARHFTDKLFTTNNEAEFLETITLMRNLDLQVMATEIIPGRDDEFVSYYSYLDDEGNPLFHFTKRKLRGYPIHFGNWCYQVTSWDQEAADIGLHFFRSVGLLGVGNVEFKRDARDGRLKLIECNHRFTASNEILRRAGVDVARLAYARATGQHYAINGFREGIHLWHPAEDIAALIAYRHAGEMTLGDWVKSLLHRQHFPVFSLSDPVPGVVNWVGLPRKIRSWSKQRTIRAAPPKIGSTDGSLG